MTLSGILGSLLAPILGYFGLAPIGIGHIGFGLGIVIDIAITITIL